MHELFEHLVMQHGAAMRARACRWHPNDVEAQKDLVQQALLQLWASQPTALIESVRVRWYLLKTVDNVAKDQHRRRQRRPTEVFNEDRLNGADAARSAVEGDLQDQTVNRLALLRCVGELSESDRIVVELIGIRQLGGVEAAAALGLNTATVWSRYRRALVRLRACLDRDKDDDGQEATTRVTT